MGCAALAIVFFAGAGCDDKTETERAKRAQIKAKQRQAAEKEEETDPEKPPKKKYGKRHREAVDLLKSIADATASYYKRRKPQKRATFPGGVDAEFRSRGEPPEAGETYTYEPPEDGGSESTQKLPKSLGIDAGRTLPAQIVYKTGEKRGEGATAVIEVVMDFDPSEKNDHTIFQELSVDPKTGKVNVFPRLVYHRWK